MLDTLINNLTQELELERPLPSHAPGVFELPLDENLKITISQLGGMGVSFYCEFAPCPETRNEELFKEALLANLFGQGTAGAVIGLNEGRKQLTLRQDIPYLVDYSVFKEILEDFINTVDFWCDESHNYSKGS
jgi:Tir chaperone protein (CesT) family